MTREENAKIAYCGLYCPLCSFEVAAETKDRNHLSAMPESYDHLKEPSFEECACGGCKMQTDFCSCRFGIKPCAEGKKLVSCADCPDFPCEKINGFGHDGTPHHEDALQSLRRIKETGYDAWLAEMKSLEHCECGARQSWYYTCAAH